MSDSETPWTAARQASPSVTNSQSLLKLMSIELVMPSNHLTLCRPLLLLPSIFPSIRVFSKESVLRIWWPEYCSFSSNISPSNGHSGLISFRIDWFDFLVDQGTLKSLLQHDSTKASILQCSAFFLVKLSHPYMTTGKIIALTRWTFTGKVMSLFFNTLSRLVITFLPRSPRQEFWSGLPFPPPMHACMLNRFSCVRLCATLWTAARQAPPSTGFSRQECWRGLPFPSPL